MSIKLLKVFFLHCIPLPSSHKHVHIDSLVSQGTWYVDLSQTKCFHNSQCLLLIIKLNIRQYPLDNYSDLLCVEGNRQMTTLHNIHTVDTVSFIYLYFQISNHTPSILCKLDIFLFSSLLKIADLQAQTCNSAYLPLEQ